MAPTSIFIGYMGDICVGIYNTWLPTERAIMNWHALAHAGFVRFEPYIPEAV